MVINDRGTRQDQAEEAGWHQGQGYRWSGEREGKAELMMALNASITEKHDFLSQ